MNICFFTYGENYFNVMWVCEYQSIRPGEAVKIDEYDIYDLDYVLQVSLHVISERLGKIEIFSSAEKGGINSQFALLWQTGDAGQYTSIKSPVINPD